MAFTEAQQIKQLLSEKQHVLITFRKDSGTDGIASALALSMFLTSQGKQVDIVSADFVLPQKITFLKDATTIQSHFPHLKKFVITIDVKKNGIQELSYDVKDEKLHIFITPQEGFLTKEHIRTASTDFRYDLIIALDTPDLVALGALYQDNSDLFHSLPIINIDESAQNERYGNINLIDLTASSTAEIVYLLLKQLDEPAIDKDIATALLTGMIGNTQSFKTDHTKPHTLANASKLMQIGADRQFIIKQLYQTKSLAALKLWGLALAYLDFDTSLGLAWTMISREDFARTGAKEEELYDIIDELIANAPEAKLILLIHEHAQSESDEQPIHIILNTQKEYNAKTLLERFHPQGTATRASCVIKQKNMRLAANEIIEQIKKLH